MSKITPEKKKEYLTRFLEKNPNYYRDYNRKYRQKNPNFNKECSKRYRNKSNYNESRKEYNRTYLRERRSTDPQIALRDNLRGRIRTALKSINRLKSEKTMDLVGCSIKELKLYLESKFESWMTWDNYGKYERDRKTWQIDHIKPCSSFDLTKIEERRICFHYTNLQPLLSIDNIKKSNKF